MTILLPVLLALFAGTPGAHAVAQDCPPVHPHAEMRIRNLLTTPLLPELRARFDLGTSTADHIELLTDEKDGDACRALWNAVREGGTSLSPADRVSFYRSGDRFFVPVLREREKPAGVVIQLDGYSSVDVYDTGFRLVGRFGA